MAHDGGEALCFFFLLSMYVVLFICYVQLLEVLCFIYTEKKTKVHFIHLLLTCNDRERERERPLWYLRMLIRALTHMYTVTHTNTHIVPHTNLARTLPVLIVVSSLCETFPQACVFYVTHTHTRQINQNLQSYYAFIIIILKRFVSSGLQWPII